MSVSSVGSSSAASAGFSAYSPSAVARTPDASALVAVSAAMEVETVTQADVSVTVGGASPGQAAQDAETAKALTTLQQVADSQREWIAALKAAYEGKPTPKSGNASSDAKAAGSSATGGSEPDPSSVQVTVTQQTTVQTSLALSAQVDISA
ncbi:hypothetical protein [Phenylobacterium sp.]|uniref:hypothetical protein n=1 Tax=Phenylobacterium sp. TaxID=1871053 RepID=UPI00120EA4DA|nr:hypothetical protein [Phenylobacterium sp.]THD64750.1 MAG: hypothetical protein E8A49_01500 [Phenylobacterium sp.]